MSAQAADPGSVNPAGPTDGNPEVTQSASVYAEIVDPPLGYPTMYTTHLGQKYENFPNQTNNFDGNADKKYENVDNVVVNENEDYDYVSSQTLDDDVKRNELQRENGNSTYETLQDDNDRIKQPDVPSVYTQLK